MNKHLVPQGKKPRIFSCQESDLFYCADKEKPLIFIKGPEKVLSVAPNEAYQGDYHVLEEAFHTRLDSLSKIEKDINNHIDFLITKNIRKLKLEKKVLNIFIRKIFSHLAQLIDCRDDIQKQPQEAHAAALAAYDEITRWDDILALYIELEKKIFQAFFAVKQESREKNQGDFFAYMVSYPHGLETKEKKKFLKIKELAGDIRHNFID